MKKLSELIPGFVYPEPNMGVVQAKAETMDQEQLIQYAKGLNLNQDQKQQLWIHWKSCKRIEHMKKQDEQRN